MALDQNIFPKQLALMLLSVSIIILSFNIGVGVVINDYCHLRGEGGGIVTKEFHDNHVGHACNACIWLYNLHIIMNRKL